MTSNPITVDSFPACTSPNANDVLLGKGNVLSNTFHYTINTLANTILNLSPSPLQTHANTTVNAYAKADLPGANSTNRAQIVYVVDDIAGPCLAVSNGTAWCKLTLGAAVS